MGKKDNSSNKTQNEIKITDEDSKLKISSRQRKKNMRSERRASKVQMETLEVNLR